ncbi:conserved hypothetical protein [Talaromyces stipitatus ATCC 10500]|uniref:Uncharacterized protein n=1 Tax=Talaromyces stipitatus (strain ATCC 10500 / CBS 375.48 / QM 6759 / NRRL 1006) TaxID=441959 RepID=B8MBW0_TALSN|nr:uncharacterized protein TSTA_119990 [Talaromyces stipitatus ATCC 10500]EED18243.1 conserved hypothetical protein [Talaromyces stipitatus ATCC 10500]
MVRSPIFSSLSYDFRYSGNYDYPPASNSTSRSSTSSRPQENRQTRLQNLRDLILFDSGRSLPRPRSETARALEALDEIEQLQLQSARRRRIYEQAQAVMNRQLQQVSSEVSQSGAEDVLSPPQPRERGRFPVIPSRTSSTAMNQESGSSTPGTRAGRRRIRPSETAMRLLASRTNRSNRSDDASSSDRHPILTSVNEDLDRRLATMTSINEGFDRLNASLRSWLPNPSDLDAAPRQSDSPGSPGSRWRSKRRKLESDDNRDGLTGFSYGHYGQVVPGLLKMEINSCDGGNYYDEDNGESSWPGNVLLDDSSVYCTKRSRCNIILNHRGETPFSLKKIVIRAPKKGFDAPIQEGMIFVSMTSDELLERTAQYQIRYPERSRRCHNSRRQYTNPSTEYFNAYRTRNQGTETRASGGSSGDLDAQANETTWSRRSLFNPTYAEPQFRVATEHDGNLDGRSNDDEGTFEFPSGNDNELLDSGEESELFCPVDEEESDNGDTIEFNNRGRLDTRRRGRTQGNILYSLGSNDRLDSPSLIEPVRSSSGAATVGLDGGDVNGISDIMRPHARFFIEREKSMVSINFDPPVSGRYILIKLWSPYSGGNIDIESIMAHGFAGTRYFPALETR